MEFSKNGVIKVVILQNARISDPFDRGTTFVRSANFGDHDRAVECDDRGTIQFKEQIVEEEDLLPVGCFITLRCAMARRDPCLDVKLRYLSAGRAIQMRKCQRNLLLIPDRPILVLQQKHFSSGIDARGKTCRLKEEQSKQCVRLRRISDRMFLQQSR